jgi:hypothetical protein
MAGPNGKRKLSLITLMGHDIPAGPKGGKVAMLAASKDTESEVNASTS